ncbi:DUF5009 domain-containing protein [Flavihumibacter petaseus]|uniref:DUF5009 domain-containing protein n=1 Tax=Flavihumibacter petaseus NBRC 106054 TaxID=1220578 RepID=A0A0E9N227_9BACT|nr:DUF5009 domain-containing protein [Flavihumibacter petaseus]GAO44077.1 hypothetical protein FPE01S_03_01170 [Flavihumibacter petaseus NBRC 106054]
MKRNYSIDLFRGFTIIGMVLAAVIPWSREFPGWMYHAQVGPPDFTFHPDHAGITWVDLVFPFFLFAMGAAFPLALKKKLDTGNYRVIVPGIVRRGFLLVFFAITLAYFNPGNLDGPLWVNYITAILVFIAWFLIFMRFEGAAVKRYAIQFTGLLLVAALGYCHSQVFHHPFDKANSDIIILILANMAVFGSLVWLFTANNILARIAVMGVVAALWLTKDVEGSWPAVIAHAGKQWSWIYDFSFLKYLCIVLPGSILGDLLVRDNEDNTPSGTAEETRQIHLLASVSLLLLVFHLVMLYTRMLRLDLGGHLLMGIAAGLLCRKWRTGQPAFYKNLFGWGFALITIGLCVEPWEGGIKKDPSSFGYWLVTGGLAFLFYLVCDSLVKQFPKSRLNATVIRVGQNPMLAYCVVLFFVVPVLGLLQLRPVLDTLAGKSPYLGLIRTAVYMGLMIGITGFATQRKWFWRS